MNIMTIAGVTAVLKRLLENGLVDRGVAASIGGDVSVTALPPDRIVTGQDERAQLNLFLCQVTPNTGLRQASRSMPNLDLHYLLSAYGAQDLQAEILLAYAIQLFSETPVLKGDAPRAALSSLTSADGGGVSTAAMAALATAHLAEQIEQITLAPQFLSMEEIGKIWSATHAPCRPSVVYRVSLVLPEKSD